MTATQEGCSDLLKHSGTTALPRTYVGRWLRAGMLDQREERDRLVRALNGGSATGWNDDEPAVVQAAIELVLSRYYGSRAADPSGLESLVTPVNEALVADSHPDDVEKAEAVIHSAAGDDTRGIEMVARIDRYRLRAVTVALASAQLELSDADVDSVLREAERVAFEQGFHPPLVQRRRAV
jgi:hypothetical protein